MSLVPYAGLDPYEWHACNPSSRPAPQPRKQRPAMPARKPALLPQMQALFRNGHDTYEIAQRFGLTEAQVYNRLAKARAGK